MKKVAYLTGTRAEFGLMKNILKGIEDDKDLELQLLVTGMHLMDEFGYTISQVDKEFEVSKVIEAVFSEDNRKSMARFLGQCLKDTTEALIELKPNIVMVLGDRAEQLAMAQAAAYLNIPLVHLHGGEETTTIDDKARKAISQLADWHLTATEKAKKRLIDMGINNKYIQVVGAPGLDEIKQLKVEKKRDLIVVLQHPDENEDKAQQQIRETLEAVVDFKTETAVIYPNADAGGRKIIEVIEEYRDRVVIYKSITREGFIKLLSQANVLVGNSSAGLIEAPSLKLGVVNVGPRQKGREKGPNVIDVDYDKKKIKLAIEKAMRLSGKKMTNPYGDGKTTERMIKFLKQL